MLTGVRQNSSAKIVLIYETNKDLDKFFVLT